MLGYQKKFCLWRQISSTKKKSQQQKLSMENQKNVGEKRQINIYFPIKIPPPFPSNSWESYLCFGDLDTIPGLPSFLVLHYLFSNTLIRYWLIQSFTEYLQELDPIEKHIWERVSPAEGLCFTFTLLLLSTIFLLLGNLVCATQSHWVSHYAFSTLNDLLMK